MAAKKQPNPMAELQSALDSLEKRLPHFPHLGGKEREAAYDKLRRAKVLLDPEEPRALAAQMNEVSDTLDGIVANHRQHAERRNQERREEQDTIAHIRAETEKRREEARVARLALGATPII